METAEISENLWGNKLYQQRAREAFPFLVRQALMGETIFYSDLAEEMGMPNERNLNYVLGCIGTTILELAKQKDEEIPPIQCLVVNKASNLPGEGFGWFISEADFKKLDKKQKRIVVNSQLSKIYAYPKWLNILQELGLQQPSFPSPIKNSQINGGGEGLAHKKLKDFIANNPTAIGLPTSCPKGKTEFSLPSGDSVDVMFAWRNELIAVEVKSAISNIADINRGLFQCVKYRAVSEAMLGIQGKPKNVRTLLVLESDFPKELISTKNMLGIEVIAGVAVNG
jgi:hypothetical protein